MTPLQKIGRLWRTVKWLKPSQIFWRVIFRLRRPSVGAGNIPQVRAHSGNWKKPVASAASLIGETRFRLLRREYDLAEAGWEPAHLPKLFTYNLHYFDDLNAAGAADRAEWHQRLIACWIAENPPVKGSGWEPYPVSLRIVNWINWELGGNGGLDASARESLALQARFLRGRLEKHLLGNHLFANAKALIFAGFYFEGAEAEEWLHCGFDIIAEQLAEQILDDGGHFELSPMYHALAIEDLLDLINIAEVFGAALPDDAKPRPDAWRRLTGKMLTWLRMMTHPDGEIAFFNDAAFDIAPTVAELTEYARRLGLDIPQASMSGLTHLADSGYARMQREDAAALIDMAGVGPDYLPGHAHADTLSFELSLKRRRLIVNSGISQYGTDGERQRQRGTQAHSTLCLDGQDSSEVWAGFRAGRRARVQDVECDENGQALYAAASHDGYAYLPGNPIHRRGWELEDGRLTVTDALRGTGCHSAEINFHLGPGIAATKLPGGEIRLSGEDGAEMARFRTSRPDGLQVADSSWHPRFGESVATQRISIMLDTDLPATVESIIEWRAE